MGFLDTVIKDQQQKKDEAAARVLERLEFLKHAATAKIALFQEQMKADFLEGQKRLDSWSIVGRPISYLAQYRVNVHSGVSDEIKQAVKSLFRFNKHGLVEAMSFMVESALSELTNSVSAGESEAQEFFIVPHNNAIMRVDMRAWRYNFSSAGVIGQVENAFCFIASKSIIDYRRLTPSELVYFVTEALQGADLAQVRSYIEELHSIWKLIDGLQPEQVLRQASLADERSRARAGEQATATNDGWITV